MILASLLASGCTLVPADTSKDGFAAEARAIDGDTLSIDFRLLGADALERKQMCERNGRCEPCGKHAQDTAARLVRDKNAVITLTGDATYGRPVATVTVQGQDLGEEMIAAGLAIPLYRYLEHDHERSAAYRRALETATAKRAGMHAGRWIAPADWRQGQRLSCERRSKS